MIIIFDSSELDFYLIVETSNISSDLYTLNVKTLVEKVIVIEFFITICILVR